MSVCKYANATEVVEKLKNFDFEMWYVDIFFLLYRS